MGSDSARNITNSNSLFDANVFLRNDGETWNKWIVHMHAAKIHDIKENRRSSLGRNNDRDGN